MLWCRVETQKPFNRTVMLSLFSEENVGYIKKKKKKGGTSVVPAN